MTAEPVIVVEARALMDEFIRTAEPHRSLLRNGAFPEGWVERYLAFVARATEHFGERSPLPREVMEVVYNASVYCTKRYADWRERTGDENLETWAKLNELRWAGDALILGRYWKSQQQGSEATASNKLP